jgi:biopolymer transport protein ExbB/TolQ
MTTGGSQFLLIRLFVEGGVAMYPLLLCSILSVAVAINRICVLMRASRPETRFVERLTALLQSRDLPAVSEQCARSEGPLARVVQAALATPKDTPQHRQKALERALSRETSRLEQYLPVLATIGSVSPFIGLFGTVLGIMRAFRDIGAAGSAGSAVVAAGIAEALVTTAAGLGVAIVAVIAYNHLMTWAQTIATDVELVAEELVSLVED